MLTSGKHTSEFWLMMGTTILFATLTIVAFFYPTIPQNMMVAMTASQPIIYAVCRTGLKIAASASTVIDNQTVDNNATNNTSTVSTTASLPLFSKTIDQTTQIVPTIRTTNKI